MFLSALAAFFLMASPASGNESRYSDSFSESCREIYEYELGITVRCEAFGQYYDVAEGDLRFTLSFGVSRDDPSPQTWQSFANFNSIGEKLEWRFDAAGEVIATILRYYVDVSPEPDDPKAQVLVISRVVPGGGPCHVAYVHANANPNANLLAREVADILAPRFDCAEGEARWYGAVGENAPELPQRYDE